MSDRAPLRAVFDTNILFSAIGWRGTPYECLQAAMDGRVDLVICHEIVAELHEKLTGKLRISISDADRAVSEILGVAMLAELRDIPLVVDDDPDDDAVLACAIQEGAGLLVSGDLHLLRLGKFKSVKIVTAKEFIDLLARAAS